MRGEDAEQAATVQPPEGPLAYATQTTLSVDDTAEVLDVLRARFPALSAPVKEDICYATTNRQAAVKAIAERCELIVVVGAANSSNSVRLREVAERAGCPRAVLVPRGRDEQLVGHVLHDHRHPAAGDVDGAAGGIRVRRVAPLELLDERDLGGVEVGDGDPLDAGPADEVHRGPVGDVLDDEVAELAQALLHRQRRLHQPARLREERHAVPLALGDGRQDGEMLPGGSEMSPATQEKVDQEAQRIVETAEREVIDLLERERPRLDALAHALLERETLDQPEAYRIAEVSESGADQNGKGELAPAGLDPAEHP